MDRRAVVRVMRHCRKSETLARDAMENANHIVFSWWKSQTPVDQEVTKCIDRLNKAWKEDKALTGYVRSTTSPQLLRTDSVRSTDFSRSSFTALALLPLAAATPAHVSQNSPESFDYIVVGGGTAGLVVANRLSEQQNISVLVIEAGGSVYNNSNVTDTAGYGNAFGTSIDWAYQSVNQEYGGGKPQTLRAGKALGGSTTINGMVYTRAQDAQINAWEAIGNEGWNWENLFPYYKKGEGFQIPSDYPFLQGSGVTYNSSSHGYEGPLKVGWPPAQENDGLAQTLNQTYQSFDVPYNEDLNGGNMVGFSLYPTTVDSKLDVREDAARAYYYPYQSRKNLHVLSNTHANRLKWENSEDVTANGVEVTLANGTTAVVHAKREVILSAGSLRSPILLEYSGIGNPRYGIKTKVDLPTVGENLQDQMNNAMEYQSKQNHTQVPDFVAYPTISHLYPNTSSQIGDRLYQELPHYAAKVASANNNVTKASDLEHFFKIQWSLIFESKIPVAEVLVEPTGDVFDTEYWSLVPFARGNIHITSADPMEAARIDPKYFMLGFDFQPQVQVSRFIRHLYSTQPLANQVGTEISPSLDTVATNAKDEAWSGFIKSSYRSNFHPISTAAMVPKEIGGVVDTSLKVYGTSNVRIVDGSVLPFQVCGHLQATIYAVAERAADIIKSGI